MASLAMEASEKDLGNISTSFEMQQARDSTFSWMDEEPTMRERDDSSIRRKRAFLGIFLALALVFIAIDYFTERRIEHACLAFIAWVAEHPMWGILAVICVYTLATILFIPGAILTIGCGFAFRSAFDSTTKGVAFASAAVFIGAFIGSLCSFLLGRYLFRDCVLRLASGYPVLQAIDRGRFHAIQQSNTRKQRPYQLSTYLCLLDMFLFIALGQNGLKIMLLLRLSPLIPFNALDYISGVTSISFRDYALALVGILPGTIMFCMVGATASSLTDTETSSENQLARRLSLIGGLLFAFFGVTVASYYSKQELDKVNSAVVIDFGISFQNLCLSLTKLIAFQDYKWRRLNCILGSVSKHSTR